ncbi:uncharacterized protein C8Q71DRAFT_789778 [Rhodofomes roseus]|uniref:Uncharacterized protein n=1 Tax=Rhodofomes roseus TaxID=34475 RepID=A0ABQ8JZ04_9APHY|nr:uncharacterized protein C8Q71DRAFT_789778 [Rhodofomes roseus]KAH9829539.1 hypothetical protein C8Q71DRAFT_789778 [Rhodofomes roseus]
MLRARGNRRDDSANLALSSEVVRALANELKNLRKKIARLEDKQRHLDAKARDAETRSLDLENENNLLKTRSRELQVRNSETEGEVARLQQELDDTRKSLQDARVGVNAEQRNILDAVLRPIDGGESVSSKSDNVKQELNEALTQSMSEMLDNIPVTVTVASSLGGQLIKPRECKPLKEESNKSSHIVKVECDDNLDRTFETSRRISGSVALKRESNEQQSPRRKKQKIILNDSDIPSH